MLFLHAGTVKTGTTYLQKSVYTNRTVFERHGITYLPPAAADLELPRYANAKFLYDPRARESARELIFSPSSTNVLVSEEGMFGFADHLLDEIFGDLPRRVILYVRRTAELLSSWAAELMHPYNVVCLPDTRDFHPTNRRILPFEEALNVASHEYAVSIGRFMHIVDELGPEKIIVRPYEKCSLVGGDLLADFASCLGLDAAAIKADPDYQAVAETNVTSSRKFCDVSNVLWESLGRPNDLSQFNFELVQSVTEGCGTGDPRSVVETLSDSQIGFLTYRFQYFEAFISKKLLGGSPLFESRYPTCYGTSREPYRVIESEEARDVANAITETNQVGEV